MFKGILGGDAKGKKSREQSKKDTPKKDAPGKETPKKGPTGKDNPEKRRDQIPPKAGPSKRRIDILKFPLLPFKWPTSDMSERDWHASLRLSKEDVDYSVEKWWQKVQLFYRAYDPYTLELEEELQEANKTIRRLRGERDAWRKEHDDVYLMYSKLKLENRFKE
ncbi:hypothetical protein TWF730_001707 [Orbilia blumenaviensis]|uniref:Uncharacterized protein n=1 Tax=Orbilia blumenaviensis TaxID=1796055 RepID=A0AAV9ULK7_9PEZI